MIANSTGYRKYNVFSRTIFTILVMFAEVDYEQQSSYSLTLEAKDGGNRSTHVVILVEIVDVNDNVPVFNLPEYRRTIREGGTEFQPKFFVQVRKSH